MKQDNFYLDKKYNHRYKPSYEDFKLQSELLFNNE